MTLGPLNSRMTWLLFVMVMEEVSGYWTGYFGIHRWIDKTYIILWSKSKIAAEDVKLSYADAATQIGVLCISLLHLSSLDKLFLPCREISLFLYILYASLL